MTWTLIAALGAGSYLIRYSGLALAGRAQPRPLVDAFLALVPPALLAGLITVQTFSGGEAYVVDARLPGVLAALVALGFRRSFMTILLVGVGVTAVLRALGLE